MSPENPWWPVALAREIEPGKPKGVFVGEESIVLFRDQQGMVRALENRCPHRRVPLSLGKVLPNGLLQCGYHGWSFDGVSGQCKNIPNLRPNEPVPASYGVFAYRAAEQNGLVYVAQGGQPLALPDAGRRLDGRVFSGRATVGLAHRDYIAALMDGPHLLLDCAGIRIANTMISDPHLEDGLLVMERAAFWTGQSSFDGFVREYKLIFRLELTPATGEAWIRFERPDRSVVAAAHMAISPGARGTTSLLWQTSAPPATGMRPALLRLAAALGRAPIAPQPHPDMAALANLIAGPSDRWPQNQTEAALYGDRLTKERARI